MWSPALDSAKDEIPYPREAPTVGVVVRFRMVVASQGSPMPSFLASDPGICIPAASAGPERDADDISVNPITKLMVPGPNCAMLPASGHAGSIPHGYFVHPDTGRVLPEAGNLGYDLQAATLVPTTDFSSGETLTIK